MTPFQFGWPAVTRRLRRIFQQLVTPAPPPAVPVVGGGCKARSKRFREISPRLCWAPNDSYKSGCLKPKNSRFCSDFKFKVFHFPSTLPPFSCHVLKSFTQAYHSSRLRYGRLPASSIDAPSSTNLHQLPRFQWRNLHRSSSHSPVLHHQYPRIFSPKQHFWISNHFELRRRQRNSNKDWRKSYRKFCNFLLFNIN